MKVGSTLLLAYYTAGKSLIPNRFFAIFLVFFWSFVTPLHSSPTILRENLEGKKKLKRVTALTKPPNAGRLVSRASASLSRTKACCSTD